MKITFFFTLIFFSCELFSQESLYLISAHPFNGTDIEFESYLWKHSKDSLTEIFNLSNRNDYLENVKIYPQDKIAVIHKISSIRERKSGKNHRLQVLSFSRKLDQWEVKKNIDGRLVSYNLLLDKPLISCYFDDGRNPRVFELLSLEEKEFNDGSINSFQNSYLSGEYGGSLSCGDYIVAYSSEEDGFLSIPFHGDKSKRPKFPYELPEEYQFKSYSRHLVPINNDEIFVVAGTKETKQNQMGSRQIIVFNKQEKIWHDFPIKGNLAKIRGFGQWITGYIANEQWKENQKLPGSEIWTDRDSGLSPAERYTLYAPGILYLYNSFTQEYYEWKTDQADSEVILVWEGKVIYRVYDELYQGDIVEGDNLSLTNTKLLIKSDVVPDIHWAFFGDG